MKHLVTLFDSSLEGFESLPHHHEDRISTPYGAYSVAMAKLDSHSTKLAFATLYTGEWNTKIKSL